MNRVLIVAATRTPIGRRGGQLCGLPEHALAALAMTEVLRRANLTDGGQLDEIIIGVARQTSRPSNCARHAALLAGIADTVPAYTVQRQGASGLQAILSGFFSILCGDAELVLAGGAESASQTPLEIQNARYHFDAETDIVWDPVRRQQIFAQPPARYGERTPEALEAEIAKRYGIEQMRVEQYVQDSQRKYMRGNFEDERFPIEVTEKKMARTVVDDERMGLAHTMPSFCDGAAMCLLATDTLTRVRHLPTMAEIVSVGVGAAAPDDACAAAVEAARGALKRAGLEVSDLDFVEIHEMSAAHVLAVADGLDLSHNEALQLNPYGGALVEGCPWGAMGALLAGRAARMIACGEMRCGLVVMPTEGGQGVAMVLRKWNGGK